jgi:hypothetical protein
MARSSLTPRDSGLGTERLGYRKRSVIFRPPIALPEPRETARLQA